VKSGFSSKAAEKGRHGGRGEKKGRWPGNLGARGGGEEEAKDLKREDDLGTGEGASTHFR